MTISKREEIKQQRLKKKRKQRMGTLMGIGGFILIAVLLLASPWIVDQFKPVGAYNTITSIERPMVDGKALGDPNAPVQIEVFEDFQCPACRDFSNTVEAQLVESEYISSGLVYYIYRQYPFLDDGSSLTGSGESDQSANASMCANEQGRFWDYHDMLFANQNGENRGAFSDRRLIAFAEAIGLDMDQFESCFDENRYQAEIEAETQRGLELGVRGTPTVFINGQPMGLPANSVPSFEDIQAEIQALLSLGG